MHFSIIPICLALFGVATAQNQFSSPKGGVENEFSQTWFEGDAMNIEWYGEWKGTGAGADVVDLWVTWFHSPAFSQLILPNIKMGDDGTTTWKINVTNSIAKEDNRFVLRLKPHTSPPKYIDTINQASGVGITIQPNGNSDTTSSSTSISSSTISTSASSTSFTSTTPSTSATTAPPGLSGNTGIKKKKISIGPIVGGVLGGLLLLILILVAVLMLLRMKKKNNKAKDTSELAAGEALMAPQFERQEVKYYHDAPLGGGIMAPVELADTHGTRPGQGFAHELPAAPTGGGSERRR